MHWQPDNKQIKALSFAHGLNNFGLSLSMGIGKTSICLQIIKNNILLKKSKSYLIVAPLKVCYQAWPSELEKWDNFSDLSYTILHADDKVINLSKKFDIYLINPAGLPWLLDQLYSKLKTKEKIYFDSLIVDESTKFKGGAGKQGFEILCLIRSIFKNVTIMTGTITPNSMLDLWSQIYILDQGERLGKNYYQFRNKYFYKKFKNDFNYHITKENENIILNKISDIVLDLDYDLGINILDQTIFVKMRGDSKSIYEEFEKKLFIKMGNNKLLAESEAELQNKCQQLCNGFFYEKVDGKKYTRHFNDIKVKKLLKFLKSKPDERFLIGYHFKTDQEKLLKFIPDLKTLSKNEKENEKLFKQWNNKEIKYLAINYASGGHGLNLQDGSNNLILYSLTWNLENFLQLVRRIARRGQKKNVNIYFLICSGTMEIAMKNRLLDKERKLLDKRKYLRDYKKKSIS